MKLYREGFKKLKFFQVPCENAYEICNKVNSELTVMEKKHQNLLQSSTLFDLMPPDSTKMNSCRRELKMLKQIWDFVYAVESCINDWKKTPWKKINTETMNVECKNFGRAIRQLDKDMRVWQPYMYVETILKNLLTSLSAINELQSPSIRDRHWAELMHTTKVSLSNDGWPLYFGQNFKLFYHWQ
jgi:dynein heavy chain